MSLENQETKITLEGVGWSYEARESLLRSSSLLKNIISDTQIIDNKIPFPKFEIPINRENLEKVFNFVEQFSKYEGDKNNSYQFALSIFGKDDYFMKNFGDILQLSQFLQVDCLTKILERYLAEMINDISTVDQLCETFGWEKTEIHTDLQWTTQSNDW